MTRISKDRGALGHDDRLDALAIAVAYWVEQMAADADKEMDVRKNDVFMQELQKFKDTSLFLKGPQEPKSLTWM
jgi:hypothetical protein